MKRDYSFQEILSGTIRTIEALPIEPPVCGLAGFLPVDLPDGSLLQKYDNAHFAMGTAYYKLGIRGIADKARNNALDPCRSQEQKALLNGIAMTYDAIGAYFRRYSESIADIEIAERLRRLSAEPPRSFEDAVQIFFLMWSIRNLNRCSCIGRLDQHLKPFYEADIISGRLTRDKAFTVICGLWKRLNEWGSGDTLMNVMLGGQDQYGNDDSSELSIIMMKASCFLNMTEPHINVRVHSGMRSDFKDSMIQLQQKGYGQATVYNDDVIIPEMVRKGIPIENACRYANDGCTEIFWDGLGDIEFNHIDAVATLDLALNNGELSFHPTDPIQYFHVDNNATLYKPHVICGYQNGCAEECENFEELYQLFMEQYRYQLHKKLDLLYQRDEEMKKGILWGLPFLNGTYEECLESGKDLAAGGLPLNSRMVFLGSIPTVADSLVALKIAVFDRKLFTLKEIKTALKENYVGYESMRSQLLNMPKFGNDQDEVDLIAARIVGDLCDIIDEYREEKHYAVFPALIGWMFVSEAYGTGAMPDGRKEKDPIAEHYCATPGKAKAGITAHICSIAKAPLARAIGVAPVHLSLQRDMIPMNNNGKHILEKINDGCLIKGLQQYNIAIYDNDLLRQAQVHPEEHGDLIVRVWGFCARFVELSKEMQDHIISRSE